MQSLTKLKTETLCPWLSQIKPWNGQGTYVDHLANHYALMAMNPKSIDHARHMVKQYKTSFPGLDTLIAKRLKELNANRQL
jgi:hypothetical protein